MVRMRGDQASFVKIITEQITNIYKINVTVKFSWMLFCQVKKKQWCWSALIVCGSRSTKFDDKIAKLISSHLLKVMKKIFSNLYLNLRFRLEKHNSLRKNHKIFCWLYSVFPSFHTSGSGSTDPNDPDPDLQNWVFFSNSDSRCKKIAAELWL